jgi:hypothetical protein
LVEVTRFAPSVCAWGILGAHFPELFAQRAELFAIVGVKERLLCRSGRRGDPSAEIVEPRPRPIGRPIIYDGIALAYYGSGHVVGIASVDVGAVVVDHRIQRMAELPEAQIRDTLILLEKVEFLFC